MQRGMTDYQIKLLLRFAYWTLRIVMALASRTEIWTYMPTEDVAACKDLRMDLQSEVNRLERLMNA